MKLPAFDDLILLPEGVALERHIDARNYRVARWLLPVAIVLAIVGLAKALDDGLPVAAIAHGASLAWLVAMVVVRRRPLFERSFRLWLLTAAALAVVSLRLLALGASDVAPFVPFALVFIALRLRPGEHLLLYGLLFLAAALPAERWLGVEGDLSGRSEELVPLAFVGALCLLAALLLSRGERRRFLLGHRRESSRSRERLRMREEIETARRIQVSMLPQAPPEIPWLELSAVSLPATEVGGDYYDYFVLSPDKVALVVGDVAGHGLASGLLLSGVRSCLYLLEEDLATPASVLARLDAMVRRTTDKRTHMTLLVALLERDDDGGVRLRVASAGHPAVLRFAARLDALEEIGPSALPLGTALTPAFAESERRLRPGDFLALYTDGLVESRGPRGQEYGIARLERTLRRAAQAETAREARDEILGDLANLKGDAEQADDITLVVARLR